MPEKPVVAEMVRGDMIGDRLRDVDVVSACGVGQPGHGHRRREEPSAGRRPVEAARRERALRTDGREEFGLGDVDPG